MNSRTTIETIRTKPLAREIYGYELRYLQRSSLRHEWHGCRMNIAKVPSSRTNSSVFSSTVSNIRLFCLSNFSESRSVGYLNCQKVTYPCKNCGKVYNYYSSLARHLKHECGVEPKFHCPLCPYRTKHKSSLNTHLNGRHMKLLSEFYAMPNGNKLSSSMDAGN